MGDVINLKHVRKQQRRERAQAQAAQNRVSFGRSKAERVQLQAEAERIDRQLTGKRLDGDANPAAGHESTRDKPPHQD